MENGG